MAGEDASQLKETAPAYATVSQFPKLRDPAYPVHRVADRLEPYLRVIVERFHPERIILFGSYASGEPRWDSDFDLLVVRRDAPSEKDSVLEIRRAFRQVTGVPPSFTILSKTPDFIRERLADDSPFYREILDKGLELYAA